MKKYACRYAIVQFVPYTETGEFANVGIVLACPATGYFDFLLQGRKYARVTAFFPELEGALYRDAVKGIDRELARLRAGIADGEHIVPADAVRDTFVRLVHPREAIIRFCEPRVVLTEDPRKELRRLFEHYVNHSFADREYVEVTMTKRLQAFLRTLDLRDPFRPARLGDDVVYANFPLVQKNGDEPRKVIKPFNLTQADPGGIFSHADGWIARVRRLRARGLLPEQTLFTVKLPPKSDAKRFEASQEVIGGLRDEQVIVLPGTAEDDIRRFALE